MTHSKKWIQRFLAATLTALLATVTVAAQADETITYIHWDALGSPVAATDEDGNVVWREAYRPYGTRINNEAAAGPHSHWYTGHPQDADTGLVYAGARYYDPVIGRFLAIDPVGVKEDNLHSFNRYAYANNNPYGYIDPDGREAQSVLGDVPANPTPGPGTWITAGAIAAPLGVGLALSRTAVAVGTNLALGEVGFSGGAAATGAAAASGLSRVAKGPLKNASGNLDDAARAARTQQHQREITQHANQRLQTRDRRVTNEALETAITRGQRNFDLSTGKTVHNLPASQSPTGRGVTTVTNHRGGVVTVIDKGGIFDP